MHEHSYGVVPSAHQNIPLADGLNEKAPSSWSLHVLLLPIFLLFPVFLSLSSLFSFHQPSTLSFSHFTLPDICAPIVVLMHGGGSSTKVLTSNVMAAIIHKT